MALLTSTMRVSWYSHDSWSETYIGIHRIVNEILPQSGVSQRVEDGALCQLALVGANHLMEVVISDLLKPFIDNTDGESTITQKEYEKGSYYSALINLVPKATGRKLDFTKEPFISTEILRKRRNATIHKSSALATAEMARASLYSAVEGSKELFKHFDKPFTYKSILDRYPLDSTNTFSSMKFP